jgi:protein-S-isoprenylcysteine O-methyltransferase Ste14
MYAGLALGIAATVLVTDNWYIAVTGGSAFLIILARTRIEERNLVARFGRDYEDYMARTGRLIPRFHRR